MMLLRIILLVVLKPASRSMEPLDSSNRMSSPQWNEGSGEPVKMGGMGFGAGVVLVI